MQQINTITLSFLLSHPDETIRRNAVSIMKRLQKLTEEERERINKFRCIVCGTMTNDHASFCPNNKKNSFQQFNGK